MTSQIPSGNIFEDAPDVGAGSVDRLLLLKTGELGLQARPSLQSAG